MKQLQLYDYLIKHSFEISKKWFHERNAASQSIYSTTVKPEIEKVLVEQHSFTVYTIASSFLENKQIFEEQLLVWARTVAKSRVETNTPIFEVLEALSKTRKIIWEFIQRYCEENIHFVTNRSILNWSNILQVTFDRLIHEFSKLYYQYMNQMISHQKELLREVSTPLIPLGESIAILPLVGNIDTERAQNIFETVPEKCVSGKIDHLFIDGSGVPEINEFVGRQMYQLLNVLRLLGVRVTYSGISSCVALSAVQLGLDLSIVESYATLNQALKQNGFSFEKTI